MSLHWQGATGVCKSHARGFPDEANSSWPTCTGITGTTVAYVNGLYEEKRQDGRLVRLLVGQDERNPRFPGLACQGRRTDDRHLAGFNRGTHALRITNKEAPFQALSLISSGGESVTTDEFMQATPAQLSRPRRLSPPARCRGPQSAPSTFTFGCQVAAS